MSPLLPNEEQLKDMRPCVPVWSKVFLIMDSEEDTLEAVVVGFSQTVGRIIITSHGVIREHRATPRRIYELEIVSSSGADRYQFVDESRLRVT